jgi:hypothetical protein
MRGLGGTPLHSPPYVSQQAAPDEAAPQSNDLPVSRKAASRGRIPAPHSRLSRQCSAGPAGLDAEVPKALREPGWRWVPQLRRTHPHQPTRRRPEVTHDAEDKLLARGVGHHREGDGSHRGRTIATCRRTLPAADDPREPGRAGTEPHEEADEPRATEVRMASNLIYPRRLRCNPDRVPRNHVICWDQLFEKRVRLRCWLVSA